MRKSRAFPGLAMALALSACATAGPDYAPPTHSVSTEPEALGPFQSANSPVLDPNTPLPDHWWRLYDDPLLDELIEEALKANADLRVAQANIARAEAVLREAKAGRNIATSISGSSVVARPNDSGQFPNGVGIPLPGVTIYDLGLSASYPLDLNGRIRRAIEANRADVEATIAARDFLRVSVAAATTRAYAQVCSANYLLAVNRKVVALQRDTAMATKRLASGGRGTSFDVSRAQTAVETSEAELPLIEAQRQIALYVLAALVDHVPAKYSREAAACSKLPTLKSPLPTGNGAELIRRRPDIRQAERALAADTARLGVVMAELYPQISLGGSLGIGGPLEAFGSSRSFGMSLGPLLSWSFPNRPVVRARIAGANAQIQADIAAFDGSVIEALRHTESALETYRRNAQRSDALNRASISASLSAQQAHKLFRFGRGDFLSLLDAQRSYASAEVASATAKTRLLDDQITVFMNLGGGWE